MRRGTVRVDTEYNFKIIAPDSDAFFAYTYDDLGPLRHWALRKRCFLVRSGSHQPNADGIDLTSHGDKPSMFVSPTLWARDVGRALVMPFILDWPQTEDLDTKTDLYREYASSHRLDLDIGAEGVPPIRGELGVTPVKMSVPGRTTTRQLQIRVENLLFERRVNWDRVSETMLSTLR